MPDIKKEYKNFIEDLEKNIKNKEDLTYVKNRSTVLMNAVLDYVDYIMDYKNDKLDAIAKIQKVLEDKMNSIEKNIDDLKQDMYLEEVDYDDPEGLTIEELAKMKQEHVGEQDDEEYDTEIVCPYCESEIFVDLSQDISEVKCPECNNIIELDWSGNIEEEENKPSNTCGGGHCPNCKGCANNDEDDVL